MQWLYDRGILKYWTYYKDRIPIPKKTKNDIKLKILDFYKLFIDTNKIELADKLDKNDVIESITKGECETHDAHLIGEAKFAECDFFISTDGRLKEKMKKMKGIKCCNPAYISNEIKRK